MRCWRGSGRTSATPADATIPLFGLAGLLFGSFATVAAYRIPRRETIVSGRSKCPSCGRTITAFENIPVVSWIALRGRCRGCGARISARYPLTELATGILFALSAWKFGLSVEAFVYAAMFWALVVLTDIDLSHKLLPDRIVFPALAVGAVGLVAAVVAGTPAGRSAPSVWVALVLDAALLVALRPAPEDDATVEDAAHAPPAPRRSALPGLAAMLVWIAVLVLALFDGPHRGLAGAAVGAFVFSGFFFAVVLMVPAGMGGGDVKLALLLGAFVGYLEAPGLVLVAMFLSFVAGGMVGILLMAGGRGRKTAVPFGPFLALGSAIAVFAGEGLLDLYLGGL